MELASGPKEEVIHSDTTLETLDNLWRKTLSSKVTD